MKTVKELPTSSWNPETQSGLTPPFEKYCTEQEYKFRAPIEEIYDYSVLEYSFALWQWGTPVGSIPLPTATDAELIAHLLAISDPSYFTTDSTNASFFVQAARELGYYGYDTRPFKSISPSSPAKATCIA